MQRAVSRWADPVRVLTALLAVLIGVGALLVALGPGRFTTYAGMSAVAATVTLLAGASLVTAGLATSVGHPGLRPGDLAVVAGFTWFLPALVGWQEGPTLVRSLSAALSLFTTPLILHLVLVHPVRRTHRVVEAALLLIYLEAAAVAVGLALVQDPFFDPSCFANCSVNTFLLHSSPGLVQALEITHQWFTAGVGLFLVVVCLNRVLQGSRATRRRLLPVARPAGLWGSIVLAHAVAVGRTRIEDPADQVLAAVHVAGCLALMLLAGGLVTSLVRVERQKRALARAVSELGKAPAPGDVEAALRQALADPTLEIAYWLPESERYVDAKGSPSRLSMSRADRTTTSLTRDGRTMAVISQSGPLLEERLGPSLRLGLENERLQAEVLAQLEELRGSRARIVRTRDLERRRLERDLHDGAQQRLLALSAEVRRAYAAASACEDDITASELRLATQTTQEALEELRDLARGIFPASLAELGLEEALRTLADFAPLPVTVRFADHRRLSAAVENAAYFAVADAVLDAMGRSATHVDLMAVQDGSRLIVSIADDGLARETALVTLVDRMGALGGRVLVDGSTCQLEIPCA